MHESDCRKVSLRLSSILMPCRRTSSKPLHGDQLKSGRSLSQPLGVVHFLYLKHKNITPDLDIKPEANPGVVLNTLI